MNKKETKNKKSVDNVSKISDEDLLKVVGGVVSPTLTDIKIDKSFPTWSDPSLVEFAYEIGQTVLINGDGNYYEMKISDRKAFGFNKHYFELYQLDHIAVKGAWLTRNRIFPK